MAVFPVNILNTISVEPDIDIYRHADQKTGEKNKQKAILMVFYEERGKADSQVKHLCPDDNNRGR